MTMTKSAPAHTAARLFHGLSDPTRLGILLALMEGERRVTDLVDEIGGSQSNVSGHLACLRECGLVIDRPSERRQVFYRISSPAVRDLLTATERLLAANGTAIELCRSDRMADAPDE